MNDYPFIRPSLHSVLDAYAASCPVMQQACSGADPMGGVMRPPGCLLYVHISKQQSFALMKRCLSFHCCTWRFPISHTKHAASASYVDGEGGRGCGSELNPPYNR